MQKRRESPLQERQLGIEERTIRYVLEDGPLAIVQAPPGSGKTSLLLRMAKMGVGSGLRIAIGAQTNSQADDICQRLVRDHDVIPTRFAGSGPQGELPDVVPMLTQARDLPSGRGIVVGTVSKWAFADIIDPYDVFIVDEAWQMSWASFMPCNAVAARFVLIGDPGQIPPVVSIDTARWETSSRPPHRPAPELILKEQPRNLLALSLPGSRRLPADSVDIVRGFYDFDFESWAEPGDRRLISKPAGRNPVDRVIDLLSTGSVSACTIPTPDHGPPLELDEEVGRRALDIAERLLARSATLVVEDDPRFGRSIPLQPEHIGLCATHRVMNTFMELSLREELRRRIKVDTPERWQGLERPVMIFAHPLSGVTSPSAFDLETGRLCVMASRHKVSVITVARDHVGETLENYIPSADQPIGRDDTTGKGHDRHLRFWKALERDGRIVGL